MTGPPAPATPPARPDAALWLEAQLERATPELAAALRSIIGDQPVRNAEDMIRIAIDAFASVAEMEPRAAGAGEGGPRRKASELDGRAGETGGEADETGGEAGETGGGARRAATTLLAADALHGLGYEAAADPRLGGSAGRAVELAEQLGPRGLMGERYTPDAGPR